MNCCNLLLVTFTNIFSFIRFYLSTTLSTTFSTFKFTVFIYFPFFNPFIYAFMKYIFYFSLKNLPFSNFIYPLFYPQFFQHQNLLFYKKSQFYGISFKLQNYFKKIIHKSIVLFTQIWYIETALIIKGFSQYLLIT